MGRGGGRGPAGALRGRAGGGAWGPGSRAQGSVKSAPRHRVKTGNVPGKALREMFDDKKQNRNRALEAGWTWDLNDVFCPGGLAGGFRVCI